jgi:hypothetical protein
MAAGMGRETTAILGTVLAFTVLALLQGLEPRLTGQKSSKGNHT